MSSHRGVRVTGTDRRRVATHMYALTRLHHGRTTARPHSPSAAAHRAWRDTHRRRLRQPFLLHPALYGSTIYDALRACPSSSDTPIVRDHLQRLEGVYVGTPQRRVARREALASRSRPRFAVRPLWSGVHADVVFSVCTQRRGASSVQAHHAPNHTPMPRHTARVRRRPLTPGGASPARSQDPGRHERGGAPSPCLTST